LYRTAFSLFLWSGGLALAGVGGWFGYQYYLDRPAEPILVQLHQVEQGDVEITVTASGTIRLGGEQTLKSPANNVTVEQVLVAVRDSVAVGQPLVVLRNRQIEQNIRDQEVSNRKAELDLNRQREKVMEAQVQLEAAQVEFQESQELYDQGFIPKDDVEADQREVDQALSNLKDMLVGERKVELDVASGQEQLGLLQRQLQDRVVTSPINGIVLQVDVTDGIGIEVDSTLLTLGNPDQEIVQLQLPTLDAAKVRLNQLARVQAIGPEPQIYAGRLIALSPQASSDDSRNNNSGSARVNGEVLLDQPSRTLNSR
jgi:HlyD family secretion protein